ncbi:MAG TPA: hypothetical protein VIN56_10175 [Candidatus Dormibacteraeota bacterium]
MAIDPPEETTAQAIALAKDTGRLGCNPGVFGAGYRSVTKPYDPRSACVHAHRTWKAAFVCLVQRQSRADRIHAEDRAAAGF